ncbi:hypothetical protein NP493_5149g00002 [Ridgeia piscesae]|uniref:Uncharacterized protein n=1 Tax=Ridgeia piscesae TaxID=27915 RepID=A0AAD9MRR5_RIDPI|nr:hypothetical protein NP493_5149g00002 [Ridgeia piscesae]
MEQTVLPNVTGWTTVTYIYQQRCVQVGHIQKGLLGGSMASLVDRYRVIPVYTSHNIELLCSQR